VYPQGVGGHADPGFVGAIAEPDTLTRLWSVDLPREHGFEPLTVDGVLPAELRGTLYRNGPGLLGQYGVRYAHPFESDGALTAIRLDGGTASGAVRITQTRGLQQERAAGRMLFGTRAPWLRRIRNLLRGDHKNTANTSVLAWQGRLFALMEAGRPTELRPLDLATIGESDLDGAIVSWFSAHPHRVAAHRTTYGFGVEYGRRPQLHLYALPDHGPARRIGALPLTGAPMLHDFIATETHLVFFVSPVRVDVPRVLLQLGEFEQLFRWRPELATEVICVPIDRPDQPVRFETDAFFQWHFVNAFDHRGEIVVDYVRYPTFESFHSLGQLGRGGGPGALTHGRLHRAILNLRTRTLRSEPMSELGCEFPTIAPGSEGQAHAATYLVLGELRGIGRFEAASRTLVHHDLPPSQHVTEPLFVARPGATHPGDGWLLALGHDGPSARAFVAVYDAARLAEGPVARAWFDHHIPITFHGTFVPQSC